MDVEDFRNSIIRSNVRIEIDLSEMSDLYIIIIIIMVGVI